jgi:hypothetical protein
MSGVQPETEPTHRLQWQSGEFGPDLSDEEVQRPVRPSTAVPHTSSLSSSRLTASPWRTDESDSS